MVLDENIRKMRKEKGLTQEQLADIMGVSTASVSKWETGASFPEISILCQLADFFNVSVDFLLGRETLLKKCVILCNKKDCEMMLKDYVAEQGFEVYSYVESVAELEKALGGAQKKIPLVISFSIEEVPQVYARKLDGLRKQYGFKLISIQTESEDEFKNTLDIYLKCFK